MASPKNVSEFDASFLQEEDPSARPEAEQSQWRGGCDEISSDPVSMESRGKVTCSNSSKGCKWEGKLADLDRHLNVKPTTKKQLEGCPHSEIECCFCFEVFERCFIDIHQSNECPKRECKCVHCEFVASFEEMARHSTECPSAPITCKNCEKEVLQCDLEHHRNNDCPKEILPCAFGCQVELPREEMSEHERQSVAEHSVALSRTLQKAMADITTLQGEMQAHITQKTSAMQESIDKIQERMITQNERIKCLCVVVVLLASVTVVSIALLAVLVTEQSGQHSMSGIQDQTGFCRIDDCKGERENTGKRKQQDKLDEKRQKNDIKDSPEDLVDVDVSMLQVRQNAILKHLQMIPHEDILPFEFEMEEFEKYKESGQLWFSPPFYTDINGYKMRIRVKARGKDRNDVSVSAHLMVGVADDDLNWPFKQDIKIELMDQASSSSWNPLAFFNSKKGSYVRFFKFSLMTESQHNQRVTTGEMALDGFPLHYFIAHKTLNYDSKKGTQYLKDDKLKFRISVAPT